MQNGHALAVGDFDGDRRDEIVSGFRGKGYQLSIYQAVDPEGQRWRKTVLDDGGIAGADCLAEDFAGDGRRDIVCIGASTGNLKLYENLGQGGETSSTGAEHTHFRPPRPGATQSEGADCDAGRK